MTTDNIFIAHPQTVEQIEALKAIVKAFKIDYEISKKSDVETYINELQESLNQVNEIKAGNLEKLFAKDFLNEQLQSDKLNIINWVTHIQDDTVVKKIKELMATDYKPFNLSEDQQNQLDSQINLNPELYLDVDKFVMDLKLKHAL